MVTDQHVEGSGLPSPIMSKETEYLVFREIQAEIIDCRV